MGSITFSDCRLTLVKALTKTLDAVASLFRGCIRATLNSPRLDRLSMPLSGTAALQLSRETLFLARTSTCWAHPLTIRAVHRLTPVVSMAWLTSRVTCDRFFIPLSPLRLPSYIAMATKLAGRFPVRRLRVV